MQYYRMERSSQTSPSTAQFFQTHPVFTAGEFYGFLRDRGASENPQTRRNLLQYFRRRGAISPIRRGIYCSVPPGSDQESYPVDGYLLASKLAEDAVLSYHAALELHGRSYSVQNHFPYLTKKHPAGRIFTFQGMEFRSVSPPAGLVRAGREDFGIIQIDRLGQDVRVTSLERTLVDVIDRPKLSGGWEETWRSLETVPYFDIDQIVQYAILLGKRKTIAIVGLYLEQHAKELMVTETQLAILEKKRPAEPQYVTKPAFTERGKLVSRWNLVVPESIITRSWEELA
jgi:predicted transcriptional regulator of viral defense system